MQNNPTEAPDWRAEFHRLEGAYAAGTIRSYRGDIAVFEAWCAEEGIPPFPAEVDAVCRFLEDQGIEKAPATVRRRLYAIRKVHRLLRMPDPTHDEEINLLCGACGEARQSARVRQRG